jgi:predicted dehydrogenase
MTPAQPLSVAVLGAGNRAQDHLQTLGRLGEVCRLVGICDADAERAAGAGEQYGAPAFTDLERMLAETGPDLLYVIIHPDGHRAAVEVAARRGVHVVSETPVAPTLPIVDAMLAAAERHGIALEVAENVWRWPTERLKRRIVESGLIGEVTQVHIWYRSGSYHGMNATRTLIGRPPVRARGYVRETPVPTQVDRTGRRLESGPYELGLVEFAGGAICVYQYPLHHHRGNYWDVIGTAGAIIGGDLVLMRDGERQILPIQRDVDESAATPVLRRVYVETDPPIVWENPLQHLPTGDTNDEVARADILHGMWRAIREGTGPVYGAANARADQEILIAIRESALRDGTWVDLPLTALTETERRIHADYAARYGHDPLGSPDEASRTFYPFITPAEIALGRSYGSQAQG